MTKPLITRKESTRYPGLFVKKYANRVFFDNLWGKNADLLESRGHVETTDGRVVIRPFTKIFNYGENGTTIDRDEQCLYIRKINGFMACATYVPEVNDVVISTTGSLDSDYVKLAEKHLRGVKEWINTLKSVGDNRLTFMFEIVDPSDPHIIVECPGAYLIGARFVDDDKPYFSNVSHERMLDTIALGMNVNRPTWGIARFSDIVKKSKDVMHEGYVVYGLETKTVLKIKSTHYLALKAAARKKDIMSLSKEKVDEEFYPLIEHLQTIKDEFNAMEEQQRLDYMRKFLRGE